MVQELRALTDPAPQTQPTHPLPSHPTLSAELTAGQAGHVLDQLRSLGSRQGQRELQGGHVGQIPNGCCRDCPRRDRGHARLAIGDRSHMTTLQLTLALPAPQATQLIESMSRLTRGERSQQLRVEWQWARHARDQEQVALLLADRGRNTEVLQYRSI